MVPEILMVIENHDQILNQISQLKIDNLPTEIKIKSERDKSGRSHKIDFSN